MRTAKEWFQDITEGTEGHSPACDCNRCRHGKEAFLLLEDIVNIQQDAFRAGMQEATDLVKDNMGTWAGEIHRQLKERIKEV